MTSADALSVALHRNRHRVGETGWTVEPCGSCRQEAASLVGSLPVGWALVEEEAWRREQGSKLAGTKRYQAGVADGAAQERERVREGVERLLAG